MNQWDELADVFGGASKEDDVPDFAADNICIAWPSIVKGMEQAFPDQKLLSVLDYGCGGGLFCRKLHSMGHRVSGYDRSSAMIKSARLNVPADVIVTDLEKVILVKSEYDVITSIMVMQFINELELLLEKLSGVLKNDGVVLFAVFNPEFVSDNLDANKLFSHSQANNVTYMELRDQVKIPVYNRTAEEYRDIFAKYGMEQIYFDKPPFTTEFIEKYQIPCSTKYPEYLIQGFRNKLD